MNKAARIDQVPSKFLKEGADVLTYPLSRIINLSVQLSVFPEECITAKLKLLFKKGSKTDPKNYRPISLMLLVSRIVEKLMHYQLQDYLKENDLLFKHQSGFEANFSTESFQAQQAWIRACIPP